MKAWERKLLKTTENNKIIKTFTKVELNKEQALKVILLLQLLRSQVPATLVTLEGEPLLPVLGSVKQFESKRSLIRDLIIGLPDHAIHVGVFKGHRPGDKSIAVASFKGKIIGGPMRALSGKYATVGDENIIVIRHIKSESIDRYLSPEIRLEEVHTYNFSVSHGGFAILTAGDAYNVNRLYEGKYIHYYEWLEILNYLSDNEDIEQLLRDAYYMRIQHILKSLAEYIRTRKISFWNSIRVIAAAARLWGIERVITERVARYVAREYGYSEYDATKLVQFIYSLEYEDVAYLYSSFLDKPAKKKVGKLLSALSALTVHTNALAERLNAVDAMRLRAFEIDIGSVYILPIMRDGDIREAVLVSLFSKGTRRATGLIYPSRYDDIRAAYGRILSYNHKPHTFVDVIKEAIGHISIKTEAVNYYDVELLIKDIEQMQEVPIYKDAATDTTYAHNLVSDKTGFFILSDELLKNLAAKRHIKLQLSIIKYLLCVVLKGHICEYEHANVTNGWYIHFAYTEGKAGQRWEQIYKSIMR